MNSEGHARYNPPFAFILSFVVPGTGQAHNGQLLKGIALYVAYFAFLTVFTLSPLHVIWSLSSSFVLRFLISLEAALHAGRRRGGKTPPRKWYQHWYVYVIMIILGVLLGRWGRKSLAPDIEIVGSSMEPTLLSGDLVAANRSIYYFRSPRSGEVVIVENPLRKGHFLVKRVAATAGQTVEMRGGEISVNANPARAHGGGGEAGAQREEGKSWEVPPNFVFVLSDNLRRAPDSRFFGPVPASAVKARVIKIYWSWDRDRERVRRERIGKVIN
jgi:signal peptidase I